MDNKDLIQRVSLKDIRGQKRRVGSYINYRAGIDAHKPEPSPGAWFERRSSIEYEEKLPHFHGLSFQDYIQRLSPGSIWLDYGCGDAAVALQEIKQDNFEIVCEGVTYPIERQQIPLFTDIKVYREDGDDFLNHHIGCYDLITAVESIRYHPDQLATIKRAYRALKEDGVLLVDIIPNASMPLVGKDGKMIHPQLLETALKNKGYDIEIQMKEDPSTKYNAYSVAIRKSKGQPLLKIPVRLIRIRELDMDFFKRFDTDFGTLGLNLPGINYVYQLI